jgi:hypothetical protein
MQHTCKHRKQELLLKTGKTFFALPLTSNNKKINPGLARVMTSVFIGYGLKTGRGFYPGHFFSKHSKNADLFKIQF